MTYQVGGSLASDNPSYVERHADRELYQALRAGEFCYALNSRQMGKSSLLVRTRHRLAADGWQCAAIDLTTLGSEGVTPLQWYKGLATELWLNFGLLGRVNLKTWWREQEDLSLVQRLNHFFSDVLLPAFPDRPLVVFLDEIDSILSLDFPIDDFFALIRACYNQRASQPDYQRLSFAVFGVATPSDLIRDKQRTPFNIGRAIALDGFALEEAAPLAADLPWSAAENQVALREILHWTGGQPFLTQKLCQLLAQRDQFDDARPLPAAAAQIPAWLTAFVQQEIIEHWEGRDEPEHLRTIRDRLLYDERKAGRLLGLHQRMLQQGAIAADDSRDQVDLLLSGLAAQREGRLVVKNPIYRAVFNADWTSRQLAHLRPYAARFRAWQASEQTDRQQLLTGDELAAALAWSADKQLSDLDYRYLKASQELATEIAERHLAAEQRARQLDWEKAQFAIQAAQRANEILAAARRLARQQAGQLRFGWRWLGGTAALVTLAVMLVRLTGLLQGMEWAALDYSFQLRSPPPASSRVTIVAIDEADLQALGRFPVPDGVLAEAIAALKQLQPRAIGLNMYRELPVEPGSEDLAAIFANTEQLIGVAKVSGDPIPPPAILAERDRVAFADQVIDGDGKVRRILLSLAPEAGDRAGASGSQMMSISARLALDYLAAEGVTPQPLDDQGTIIRLGRATIEPLHGSAGGYVRANTGGYQLLLNYLGEQAQFETVSLRDLRAGRVPRAAIADRIVLIGLTAASGNLLFQTPYSNRLAGTPPWMAGVTIQANAIAALLRGALEGRPPGLQTRSQGLEWLWTALWASLGATLGWSVPDWRRGVGLGLLAAALLAIAQLLFLQALWLPVVPPLLALVLAAVLLPAIAAQQRERRQLQQTVQSLAVAARGEPAASRIALEYLKQSESRDRQQRIDQLWQAQQAEMPESRSAFSSDTAPAKNNARGKRG